MTPGPSGCPRTATSNNQDPTTLSPSEETRLNRRRAAPKLMVAPGPNFMTLIGAAKAGEADVVAGLRMYATQNDKPALCIDEFEEEKERYAADPDQHFKALLWLYTLDSWVYADCNRACREDKKTLLPFFVPFIKALLLGIPRCSSLHLGQDLQAGEDGCVLFRRTKLTTAQLKQYVPGTHFIWTGFTSCGPNDTNLFFGPHLFLITIPRHFFGKLVQLQSVSAFPHEEEILLPCNLGFVVRSVQPSSKPHTETEISLQMQYEINCVG